MTFGFSKPILHIDSEVTVAFIVNHLVEGKITLRTQRNLNEEKNSTLKCDEFHGVQNILINWSPWQMLPGF